VQDAIRTHLTYIYDAETRGKKEGFEMGIKLGMEKGMEKGVEKVAKSMYQMNLPVAQIIKATGLSENEINQILN
jgi:predicted transposase/invertase (TIGR01784 family)